MPRDPLLDCLQRYRAPDAGEAADVARLLRLAEAGGAWDRGLALHVTASALIVHPPTRRVLLRWHDRQQDWLQVGGHGDPGESDPIAIARREGTEETGLDDLVPWPSADLRHAVIVAVPANHREPAHHHGDLRFVLATGQPDAAVAETPTAELRWLSVADALALTGQENVRETIRRAAASM